MKIQFQAKCQCEKQFAVTCNKPNFVNHTIANAQCPLCESKVIFGVKRIPNKENHLRLSIETRRFTPSTLFLEGQLAAIAEDADVEKIANEFMDENKDLMESLAKQEQGIAPTGKV